MFTGKDDPLVRSTSLKGWRVSFFHKTIRRRGISDRCSICSFLNVNFDPKRL